MFDQGEIIRETFTAIIKKDSKKSKKGNVVKLQINLVTNYRSARDFLQPSTWRGAERASSGVGCCVRGGLKVVRKNVEIPRRRGREKNK